MIYKNDINDRVTFKISHRIRFLRDVIWLIYRKFELLRSIWKIEVSSDFEVLKIIEHLCRLQKKKKNRKIVTFEM